MGLCFQIDCRQIQKAKQHLEWFHPGLCWHYFPSTLLHYNALPFGLWTAVLLHILAVKGKKKENSVLGIISLLSYLSVGMEPNESQKCKKKPQNKPSSSSFSNRPFFSSLWTPQRVLSFSKGMQYTVSSSVWHESLDNFVYVLYNITVNDWWINRTFYFVTFHIYVYLNTYIEKYISILRCLQ